MKKMVIKIDVGSVDVVYVNELKKLIQDFKLNHWDIEIVRVGNHTNVYYFDDINMVGSDGCDYEDAVRIEHNLIIGGIQRLIEKIPLKA